MSGSPAQSSLKACLHAYLVMANSSQGFGLRLMERIAFSIGVLPASDHWLLTYVALLDNHDSRSPSYSVILH